MRDAITAGQIESRSPFEVPLDALVQHLVTIALGGGFRPDELLDEVRTTHAYQNLTDAEWAWALDFVTRGGEALRNYPEYARLAIEDGQYIVTDKEVARRHRMSIGTIVSDASLQVQYLKGPSLGHVEELFVARLKPGDRFMFAGRTVEFIRVREMTAWVRKTKNKAGLVPRWMGSRLPLSSELAEAVRAKFQQAKDGLFPDAEMIAMRPILDLQARWSRSRNRMNC